MVIFGGMPMNDVKTVVINGHTLEFIESTHTYICDGVIVPCVSEVLSYKFNDYKGISQEVLNRASQLGTTLHRSIELYEQQGITSDLKEFKNYLFLKKQFKFENVSNELPVLYERGGRVLFVGTLDQVITIDGKLGINDFKRVSAPNKEKIAYQLNLYKMAYEQSYGKKIEFLSFTHLREDVRKFHRLPINEEMTISLLNEFLEQEEQQCLQ
jgi:hypothetical protein